MNELDELIQQEGQWIKVVLGKEIIIDPEEQTKKPILNNPIPIKAIVTDLTSAQLRWKMYGIETQQGKELIIDSRHRNLIEMSQKIIIDDVDYVGWRDDLGKMQIRQDGGYLKVYVYRRS